LNLQSARREHTPGSFFRIWGFNVNFSAPLDRYHVRRIGSFDPKQESGMSIFSKSVHAGVIAALTSVSIAAMVLAQNATPAKPGPTTRPYPLDTCFMSGEKLGSMGDPDVITYQGREIKFCCSNCEADFRKDPEKYLKKLDEAIAKSATSKPAAQ
jgi:hypothetical protein